MLTADGNSNRASADDLVWLILIGDTVTVKHETKGYAAVAEIDRLNTFFSLFFCEVQSESSKCRFSNLNLKKNITVFPVCVCIVGGNGLIYY